MKSNELRIGNTIKQGTVKEFYQYGVHIGLGKCVSFKNCEPIELTEKHLSDFGFIIDDENCWSKKGLTLDKRYTGNDTYEFEFAGSCVSILFVHELQNLYFALTKDELSLSVC